MGSALTVLMTVLIVLLAIAPVPSIGSTIYLWALYRSDPGRSWLLRMVGVVGTATSLSVSYIAFLAVWRLLGFGILPDGYIMGLSITLLILSSLPVYMAVRIYRASRGSVASMRPPGGDEARDAERDIERDTERDAGRDEGRDLVRDPARDEARDEAKENVE